MTTENAMQNVTARPFQGEEDFWRVRELLVEAYPITPPGFNWDIRNWDGSYFYSEEPGWGSRWEEGAKIRLWEMEDGKVVGAVHPEGRSMATLQLHPDYRQLEDEMVAWAEENLSAPIIDEEGRHLHFYVWEYDVLRRSLLEARGYEKKDEYGVLHTMRLGDRPIPQMEMAEGYTLRTTDPGDMEDCQKIADLLNAAFNRDFHTAQEYRTYTEKALSYNNELDLAAVAPDGSFGAYAAMIFDEANGYGLFEPVCTHPDHYRKGLAKTLMLACLGRVKAMGATEATVATGDMAAANRLYQSVGFTYIYKGFYWRKVFG